MEIYNIQLKWFKKGGSCGFIQGWCKVNRVGIAKMWILEGWGQSEIQTSWGQCDI